MISGISCVDNRQCSFVLLTSSLLTGICLASSACPQDKGFLDVGQPRCQPGNVSFFLKVKICGFFCRSAQFFASHTFIHSSDIVANSILGCKTQTQAIVKHLPKHCGRQNSLAEQDALKWLIQLKDVTQLQVAKGGARGRCTPACC